MVHAALLFLMLEAANTDLVAISLKRSTPKSSDIHKLAGQLPYLKRTRAVVICGSTAQAAQPDRAGQPLRLAREREVRIWYTEVTLFCWRMTVT
jgi:hypothetical protein